MILLILAVFVAFIAVLVLVSPLIAPKKLELNGRHVLVTGGSSGIGKAVAKQVVKRGGKVTLFARNETKLSEAKAEIVKYSEVPDVTNDIVHTVSIDVTGDYEMLEAAVRNAELKMGSIDMLVNCAGFAIAGRFEELPVQEFKKLMDLNYFGALHSTKAVIKGMMKRNTGRIVYLSSQAGQLGLFGYTGYAASKFALRGLAESLEMEMKPYNIRVTIAFPPDTDTPGLKEENKTKPVETQLISENAGLYSADDVATQIINDAVRGKLLSSVGFEGFLLSTLTCGMTPVISVIDATLQVVLLGLFRAIGLIYLDSFDRIINRCKKQQDQKEKQS